MPLPKPRRLARALRALRPMSSAGKDFVKKWEASLDLFGDRECLPLDELLELMRSCTAAAVREGLTKKPWFLHQLLDYFCAYAPYPPGEGDDPQEMIEVIRTLLELCPKAAGVPVPADKLWTDEDPNILVYPLHLACYNYKMPNEVIELLLEKSTAGLDHMIIMYEGVIEGCGSTEVAGTPLHYALYWGKGDLKDVGIVKRLIEACPDALMMKDMTTHGLTPLHVVLRGPSEPDLEVVKFLVQYNPSILRERDAWGMYPLHLALANERITIDVIEFLFQTSSMNMWAMVDYDGDTPMHSLLRNGQDVKDTLAINILQLFVRMYPNESFFREADSLGEMPIHHAAESGHGGEFCKLLVELAPGCERIPSNTGCLPLHRARHIDTVKYLVSLYPESIYVISQGMTPFRYAVLRLKGMHRADIVRYFLKLDPSFASKGGGFPDDRLPLHSACIKWEDKTWWETRAEVVKILFDVYPRALMAADANGRLPIDLAKEALAEEVEDCYYARNQHSETIKITSFLETQQKFVAEASNIDALNAPDKDGMVLLHRALLEEDISLGTVKMIMEETDHDAAVLGPNPLHLACTNCAADIIQYISGVYNGLVNSVDDEGCNILHLVCKAGNLKAAKYLLEQHAPLVSETNNANLLPIHLLCDESVEATLDGWREHREHVDVVWQLLLAHPAAVSSAIAHLD